MNDSLFGLADQKGIFVEYKNLPENKSLSTTVFDNDFVALDYSLLFAESEERCHLAHELGHCMTGSFYNIYSPYDVRSRHEYRADKWAVHTLIPFDELKQALNDGCVDVWNLAERFGVTEDFVKRAVSIYQCEGAFPA